MSFIMALNLTSTVIQVGFTPLHYASLNGHTDVVKLLIDYGVHIDVPAEVQECVSLPCVM